VFLVGDRALLWNSSDPTSSRAIRNARHARKRSTTSFTARSTEGQVLRPLVSAQLSLQDKPQYAARGASADGGATTTPRPVMSRVVANSP
jgi:hypothetical protein